MVTNTKRHTEISVTDDSTNITVFGPDPQVRGNYDKTIKYIRDLEFKMRGEEFINPIIRNSEEIDSYLWDSSELMNILDSSEWVNKEDYYDI